MLVRALIAALAASGAVAQSEMLENKNAHRQICAGVYGPKDRPGPYKAQVELEFPGDKEGTISALFFAYEDIEFLGQPLDDKDARRKYLCDETAIEHQVCSENDFGKVIRNKYQPGEPAYPIVSEKVTLPHEAMTYEVEKTGYYCVATFPLSDRDLGYKAKVHFMNAYGHLPASQLPLLWFHAIAAIAYFALFALWMFGYWRYRADVLPVQRYVTALMAYLIVEQVVLWGYFNHFNHVGNGATSTRVFLAVVAMLGAGRLSMTFFLLLIVSMGYSVVFQSLGPRMKWCRILGGALFVTGTLYSLDTYALLPDDEYGTLGFFTFLPAAVTVGLFYIWTLQSLGETTLYLRQRKQHVKVRMYRLLWWILLGSALAVFAFFVIHTVSAATQSLKDFINNYWKTKWVLTEGWPNFVYFVAFSLVAFLWRPTANNRRFAMSTQLAQDDGDVEEFEIGSLNGSDYDEDADEVPAARTPSPVAGVRRRSADTEFDIDRADSPVHSDPEPDSWNRNEDRDGLVDAPSGSIR